MKRNLSTGLRCKRSNDPMGAYDRLPPALRQWLAEAALPWSARTVAPAWDRALKACGGDVEQAWARMDATEAKLLARDAVKVWGKGAPAARELAE